MGKLFYVYDDGPIRHYPTLEEAKDDADTQIDYYRAACDPEWSDAVDWLAVYECDEETEYPEEDGKLVLESRMVNVREPEDGEDESVDFYCDYAMEPPRLTPPRRAEEPGHE